MPAITLIDLENAKTDVDHIAAIATSTAPTATDRLGHVKKTMSGASADVSASVAAVEASKNTAINTTIPGQVAAVEASKNTAINTTIPGQVAAVEASKNTAINTTIPGQVAAVESAKNTAVNTTIPGYVAAVESRKNTAINTEIPAAVALVDTAVAQTAAGSATASKVAAEAARDAAQLSAQAAQIESTYSTVALGLSGTTNGKYFAVKQAYGDAIDIYLNIAGTAVYQQTRPFGIGGQYEAVQIAERNLSLVPSYPRTPIFEMHSIDQYDKNGVLLRSRVDANTVSKNLYQANTGVIKLANATTTNKYATGPSGGQTAVRVQQTNSIAQFSREVFTSGTYTIKFKAKSTAGAGAQTFKLGLISGGTPVNCSVDESAWTDCTLTFNGVAAYGVPCIHNTSGYTSPLDILIDEVQLYEGASIPVAFSVETRDYSATPLMRVPGSFSLTQAAINRSAAQTVFAPVPSFPADTAYTEMTAFAIVSVPSNVDTLVGRKVITSGGGEGNFWLGQSNGIARGTPLNASMTDNNGKSLEIKGKGYVLLASRFNASDAGFFFNGILTRNYYSARYSGALPGAQTIPTIGIFSDNLLSGTNPGGTFFWKGLATNILVFPKYLTDAEMDEVTDILLQQHNLYTGSPVAIPKNFWFAEGDSITASAPENYFKQFFDTSRTGWFGWNVGSGGSVHATANGYLPTLIKSIEDCVRMGARPIVSYFMGANGIPTQAEVTAYGNAVRAAGAKFIMCTILPKNNDATWETNRLAYNTLLRNNPSWYDGLADFGGSPTIGAFSAPAAGVYYYDQLHLSTAGQTEALAIIQPVVLSLGV